MEIKEKIDNTNLRLEAEAKNIPLITFLMEKVRQLSVKEKINHTLFAVCPNSENVLRAALMAAKRANAPVLFAATLNQVDIDRGYTGWVQKDLVQKIKEESYHIGFKGTTIICVDHGGPYVKDIQTIEKWSLDKAMRWVKKSFEEAVIAGYDLLHIDPTVDIFKKNIDIKTVANRTLELISHVENFRKNKKIKPVSYEVGTEEVHGGLADIEVFKEFLELLKNGLKKEKLNNGWPVFIVAKVGTDLKTTTFDPEVARKVVGIAWSYGSYIKGHYTDFVTNLRDYPESGIGAANVGPEFTILEYEALNELSKIEDDFYDKNKVSVKSNFKEILEKAVFNSGRWKKWLENGEKDFDSLDRERKEFILKTSCRYVWANPEVRAAQNDLYRNMSRNGIDADSWVLMNIETGMDKYFREFNLIDLDKKINQQLDN